MDGILNHAGIAELLAEEAVSASRPVTEEQLQPASLDLRLGAQAVRVAAGFLPRGPVERALESLAVEQLDLTGGAVLRRNQVYLVRLVESLRLPPSIRARANPRSSTGRIDVFTRTIVDGHDRFDEIPAGYQGGLWLEVVPRSFDIRVTTGQRLNQIRFLRGDPLLTDAELAARVTADDLIRDGEPAPVQEASLLLGLSLEPERAGDPVGWKARADAPRLDLAHAGGLDPAPWFEPVHPGADGTLVLQPEEFLLLASRERIAVPPDLAAEMLPWDVGMGELRTNYAGFFDCGFGWGPDSPAGARAVLEVRPHDVPFRVVHGQPIFRLQFSRCTEPCTQLYGGPGSAYQAQGLALARWFRR